MSILPPNELKIANQTPKSFIIWGESMSGKTYLSRQFPNPLIINTDGNGQKVDTPSIEIKNFLHFLEVIEAVKKENHTFETIIIDLIDDIQTMLSNHVCEKYQVEHEADVPFGKAFGEVKSKWKKLMMDLTQMKTNVIFISHYVEKTEGNTTVSMPSLPQAFLNMCMGRCDMTIKCTKIGNNYIRQVTARREIYTEDLIKDKATLEILKTIKGVFDAPKTLQKAEIKKADKTEDKPPVKKLSDAPKKAEKSDIKPDGTVLGETKEPTEDKPRKVEKTVTGQDEKTTKDTEKAEVTEKTVAPKKLPPLKKVGISGSLANKL